MSTERHARLTALFDELSRLEPGPVRAARLNELCQDDELLREKLEELLRFDADGDHDDGAGFVSGLALRHELDSIWGGDGSILRDTDVESPTRYEILRLLGEGGFGSVYLAQEQEPIARLVAIKRIKPGMDTREVLARFEAERRALGAMEHPSIARVFAAGSDPSRRPYFVMEYVEGQAITEFCDTQRLSVSARLELLIEVCQAVQHAHQKGIVHRDLKSSNVLVSRVDGRPFPKVIDFGIAKAVGEDAAERTGLTREGQLIGTPLAMSPEQVSGVDVDTRADVYALGALAYELLTGSPPLAVDGNATDLALFRQRILHEEPVRPSVRLQSTPAVRAEVAAQRGVTARILERQLATDLDWIILRALAKEPARRYASASDLAEDVRRFLRNEPVAARRPSRSYQAAKFAKRHRVGLAAAAAMLLLLLAGTIGTGLGWRRSARALEALREQEGLTQANLTRALAAETDAKAQAARALRESQRAQEQAELALAINRFLTEDLLSSVSPESQGYSVSMRSVLDVAANRIAGRFDQTPDVERSIRATLGKTYRALSLQASAEEQLTAALALAPLPDATDPRPSVRARGEILLELGRVHLQNNENAATEELLRSLWEQCSETLGDEDLLTIEVLHFLAVSLAEQHHFDEAAELFDRVRTSALDAVGKQHELSTQALHSQGLLGLIRAGTSHQQPSVETVRMLEEALGESRTLHGADDPRTIRRMIDVAHAVLGLDRRDQGVSLLEEAYACSRRVQGPNHPTTAAAILQLGQRYIEEGSLEKADAALQEAYEITKPLGADQPMFQHSLYAMARLRMLQKRLDEALELALALWETPDIRGRPTSGYAELIQVIYHYMNNQDQKDHWGRVRREAEAHATEQREGH